MLDLFSYIQKSKNGDNESLEYLLEKFEPLINKLSRNSNNEFRKTDLTIFFIKLIRQLQVTNIKNSSEGGLVNYIYTSLYRKDISLNKKRLLFEVELKDICKVCDNQFEDIEFTIFLNELLYKKIITKKQSQILHMKYYYLNTDQEIAALLGISRQAVNKINRLAINNIRNFLNISEVMN